MKIDIEALIIAKREAQEKKVQAQNDQELERRERRMQRQKDKAEQDEKRLRKHAEFVCGCLAEYLPIRLHSWFLLDNWTVQEGLILLCGFDPSYVPINAQGEVVMPHLWVDELHGKTVQERLALSRVRRLDNLPILAESTVDILGEDYVNMISTDFELLHARVVRIWNSGTHTEQRYPPKYFIEWAISKRLPVDWLEWAQAEGYYGERPQEGAVQVRGIGKEVSPKSEAAYLNIIGALGELYWAAAHPEQEYSQAALLAALKPYEGFSGMSERNLKDKLTKAMRAIKS